MLILYDGTTSVCGIKVRITQSEKGLEFESRNLDLRKGDQFEPDYLKLNPNAVVPTLIDGDDIILESSVIMQYLEDLAPEESLLPKTPKDRARMRLWLKRIDDPIHPACGTLTHATAFRPIFLNKSPEEQKAHFDRMPDPGRRARQEAVYRDGLEAPIVENAIRLFDKFIGDMESALNENPFIAGPGYSLADAAATPYVNRLAAIKLLDVWADSAPNVIDWYSRIQARPSFKAMVTDYLKEGDIAQFAAIDDAGAEKARTLLDEQ
ncbi:MAG: glutathione S-transferase family protein [Alphaproteobacteria bacterium]|nr:glutathione S-transferase family protein [Alphaproteobacteria bacterium]